jgi:hypothetical protein
MFSTLTQPLGEKAMDTIFRRIRMLKPARYKALLIIGFLSLLVNACTLISPKITKEKYDRVQTGMTLPQVQEIMGKPGENSAEISFNIPSVSVSPGASNLAVGVKPAVYQWKNPDGGSMTAVFINDKLVLKNQVNLK